MKKYLKPIFFDEFQCVAQNCRYNCCGGWNIYVDDITAEKYKKKNIKLDNKQRLPLVNGVDCIHLRDDGLCSLVCKYGEDMLSYTCDFFPRSARENAQYVELYLSNSCQAVLEKLIELESHLIFADCDKYEKNILYEKVNNEEAYAIRDFAIDLIQMEASDIWTRSFLAYRFVRKNDGQKELSIREDIENYFAEGYIGDLLKAVSGINVDLIVALNQKANMFVAFNGDVKKGVIYDKYIVPVFEYIKETQVDNLSDSFKKFAMEMEKYELFFENYLVNAIYTSLVPVQSEKLVTNMELIMLELAMTYFTCFLWSAVCGRDITKEELIDIAAYYSRLTEHNNKLCTEFINKLKEDGDLSYAVFYMLISSGL